MISSGLFWLANFRYPDLYLQKEFYTFLALTIPYEVGLFKRKEQQDMWHVEGVGVTVPIMSIVFGILILISPRILNYLVALYFIIVGIMGLIIYII